MSNLLDNAAKYTPPHGHVRLAAVRRRDAVEITVEDDGVGITAEQLPDIFEMFSQVEPALDRTQGGLGIGLALVRGLVELHGGSIAAASAGTGRGSRFTVRLPIGETAAPAPAERAGPSARTDEHPRRRILVVDDNHDSAESLAMLLRLGGHEVHTATDGIEAVRRAAELRPEIVLLDIGLPR